MYHIYKHSIALSSSHRSWFIAFDDFKTLLRHPPSISTDKINFPAEYLTILEGVKNFQEKKTFNSFLIERFLVWLVTADCVCIIEHKREIGTSLYVQLARCQKCKGKSLWLCSHVLDKKLSELIMWKTLGNIEKDETSEAKVFASINDAWWWKVNVCLSFVIAEIN